MATVPNSGQKDSVADAERDRVEQTLSLVKTLLTTLPEVDRERFYREIVATVRSMTAPRAGEVLGTIVRLLPERKSWTVAELKQRVEERGISATAKEVYNAVGYLKRRGRVTRVAYGRYMVDGVEVVTSDDLGLETTRHEDEYRTNRD
jgi:hypothetical protein